jgi:diguanylate cyclase (GGDEF)-like protein
MLTKKNEYWLAFVLPLLFIPIFLLGYQFINASQKDINFAKKEIEGVEYLSSINKIVFQLTTGETKFDVAELENDANLYDRLMSTKADSDFLIKTLSTSRFERQKSLDAALQLSKTIGDQSNLILDPDLDSYYLVDSVITRLPKIMVLSNEYTSGLSYRLGKAAQMPSAILARKLVSGQLEALKNELEISYAKSLANNADGSAENKLNTMPESFIRLLSKFIVDSQELSDKEVIMTPSVVASEQRLIEQQKMLSTEATNLWDTTAQVLTHILETRVNRFNTILNTSIAISAVVSILALGITIFAVRSTLSKRNSRIMHLAHHDALTDLPNRAHFTEVATAKLAKASKLKKGVAVFFVDLDRFKSLNDLYGHQLGDQIIKMTSHRLLKVVRRDGIVSRMGGDEFVVYADLFAGKDGANLLAARLVEEFQKPLHIEGRYYPATASIGYATNEDAAYDLSELLKSADIALYASKAAGRNNAKAYNADMRDAAVARIAMEQLIANALRNDTFSLDYQPLYDEKGSHIYGFEALLRLKDCKGNNISPAVFIPVAEQSRQILEIGRWVLKRACATAKLWPKDLTVSVNISPIELQNGDAAESVAEALSITGLEPHRLEIEITESALLDPTPETLAQLERIRALGVKIAIDDFASGNSSFGYLWRFPFDKIKIDRSMITALEDPGDAVSVIFQSIVDMAHNLKMKVIAEGVENSIQRSKIVALGCDELQGYLLSRPMPETNLAEFILKEWSQKLNRPSVVEISSRRKA